MTWMARIVMALLGLVFLAGLALALAGYTVFAAVRWLLTGRAPQLVLVWQRMRTFQQATARHRPAGEGVDVEVVDVEVREVPDAPHRLPHGEPGQHGPR